MTRFLINPPSLIANILLLKLSFQCSDISSCKSNKKTIRSGNVLLTLLRRKSFIASPISLQLVVLRAYRSFLMRIIMNRDGEYILGMTTVRPVLMRVGFHESRNRISRKFPTDPRFFDFFDFRPSWNRKLPRISDSNSVENRKNRKTLGRSEIFLKSDSDFREIRRA